MFDDITPQIVASLIGLLFPAVKYILSRIQKKAPTTQSYTEKLASLTGSLLTATKEVDHLLQELSQVARERADAIHQLEHELKKLEATEQEQRQRLELLQSLEPETVKHLLALMEPSEKRSAQRDYILFGAGVILSTIVSVLVSLLT